MLNLTSRVFFDRPAVIAALGRANHKALSKAGAYVMTRARSSIRRRKKVSEPGKPPSSHVGVLKDRITFGLDLATTTVVIGPTPYRAGTAPRALEFGGDATIVEKGVKRVVTIRPRPFMGPALVAEAAAGNLPESWADTFGA